MDYPYNLLRKIFLQGRENTDAGEARRRGDPEGEFMLENQGRRLEEGTGDRLGRHQLKNLNCSGSKLLRERVGGDGKGREMTKRK